MALVEAVYLTLALLLAAFFALAIYMRHRYPGHVHLSWMIASIGLVAATLALAAFGMDSRSTLLLMFALFTASSALTCKTFLVLTRAERRWPALLPLAAALLALSLAAVQAGYPYIHVALPFHVAVSLLMAEAGWEARRLAAGWLNRIIAACLFAMAAAFAARAVALQLLFDATATFSMIKQTKFELATMLAMAVPGMSMTMLMIFRTVDETAVQYRRIADTDVLTGLMNRSAFIAAAAAAAPGSWLIVCDIDHFKRVNDSWGHAAGDMALKCLGSLLRTMNMAAARIGGEEFAILLPSAGIEQSRLVAEGLRAAFSLQQIDGLPEDARLTASFGVAGWEHDDTFESVFKRADAALYRAKADGRDRVVLIPARPHLPTAKSILSAA